MRYALISLLLSPPFLLAQSNVPNPFAYITDHGARAIIAPIPTTATCTNGSHNYSVVSAASYVVGDGATIYNCGPNVQTMTPGAPSVSGGASVTFTAFDSPLVPSSGGGLTYSYKLVSRDGSGGLTLPSCCAAIVTNGNPLGEQVIAVNGVTTSGTTMAIALASTGPPNGTKVHYTNGSNNFLWTYGQVLSGGGTASITINMPFSSNGVTGTGGSLIYFNGNQLTWTNQPNATQQIVCASRPADAGAYHVIGLSPILATTFNDWGAKITAAPIPLPSYINDSICTASAATNDYVSGTITSIVGNTITLSVAASQNTSGQMNLDAMPGMLATQAAARGLSLAFTTPVFIPCTARVGGNYYFPVMSAGDLSPAGGVNGIIQCGLLRVYETITANGFWHGLQGGGASITGNGAFPVLYGDNSINVTNTTLNCNGGVNGLAIQEGYPGNSGQNSQFLDDVFGCGGYSPTEILEFNGFNHTFRRVSAFIGPGDTPNFFDTTWWPGLYLDGGANFIVDDYYRFSLGMAMRNTSAQPQSLDVRQWYIQGPIEPSITSYCGGGSEEITDSQQDNDTSPQPFLNIDGNCLTSATVKSWYGSAAPPINGTLLGSDSVWGSAGISHVVSFGGVSFPPYPVHWLLQIKCANGLCAWQ